MMVKRPGFGLALAMMGACVCVLGAGGAPVQADVISDQAAAILVFPKVVVDITSPQIAPPAKIDTLIRVANTSSQPIAMHCFWIDANSHCENTNPPTICTNNPTVCGGTGGRCLPGWQETDFFAYLTTQQPVAWLASSGAPLFCNQPLSNPGVPCLPLSQMYGPLGQNGETNDGTKIPGVQEDPFVGELRCVAVDLNGLPVARNNLTGTAQIVRFNSSMTMQRPVDVETYNAVGIPAIPGSIIDPNGPLVLGGGICQGGGNDQMPCAAATDCPGGQCSAEYSGCPNLLILDSFFDGADDPVTGKTVTTDLTLVPCSEDLLGQTTFPTTAQFLVFNEFEQRLSTSQKVTCFQEFHLSDIDGASPGRSIFDVGVEGTLTGQTRLRGVVDSDDTTHGHTLLGIAEEFRSGGGGSSAFNLHFDGARPQSDFIFLP